MAGLAEELLNLRFVPRPLESLYLNDDRVTERFVGHLGSIGEWTRRAERDGSFGVDLKVINATGGLSRGNELSYDLHDITVRAILLREALQAANVIRSPEEATEGQYIICSGRACLRHPDMDPRLPILINHDEECLAEADPRFVALERNRASIESFRLALAGPAPSNDRMWLLTLGPGADVKAAAVLNSACIRFAASSYIHFNWTMFGTLRERIEGVPSLAAIHVWVTMPDNVMKAQDAE